MWRQIWECFQDIGGEAHIDSVTKCKAHLSKAEQAKQDVTTAGDERADELAKEGARDDSFQSILCDTYKVAVETCKSIIGYIDSFTLRVEGGERWPDVVTPPQGWDEKDGRWKRATPILARSHVLRRSGRHWHCEVCDKRASGGAAKAKLVRAECVGHLAMTLGEHGSVTFWLSVVLQVWSEGSQVREETWRTVCRASEDSRICEAFACFREAGTRRKIAFLDHRNCSRCKHGQGGGKATRGTIVTGLGWPRSDKR